MILNKLQSLSWPRLLHVALSLLCVLALVLGLASGALAVSGDSFGYLSDFPVRIYYRGQSYNVGFSSLSSNRPVSSSMTFSAYKSGGNSFSSNPIFVFLLPSPVSSTTAVISNIFSCVSLSTGSLSNSQYFEFFDLDLKNTATSSVNTYSPTTTSIAIPYNTSVIVWRVSISSTSSTTNTSITFTAGHATYSGFDFSSSGTGSDAEILDGIDALAQALLDLETGPYYGVSGVSVDQNGDLQHTLTQNASLEDLLNALGIAGTDTNHVIRGIYNNFGSYFTLYSIDDSTSSTTQVYRGLPQYVNALGQSVTDGINRLQRDHALLYQQTADLSDALYADTFVSPSESWSVAEWLRGIFTLINDFISSFWSPAETDLKEAAEEGMQEAADRAIAGSADQVGDMDDLGSGFSSFGSTGNVAAGDLLDSLTSGDYSFFSQTTQDNLCVHPPVSQSRGFRSAPSDQVDYVDELSKNRAALQEVLGLP